MCAPSRPHCRPIRALCFLDLVDLSLSLLPFRVAPYFLCSVFTVLQMMEELFPHISGQNSALPAMVQVLADFASADG